MNYGTIKQSARFKNSKVLRSGSLNQNLDQIVNTLLVGKFKGINHESNNHHYTGFSNKYQKNIFVKVFNKKNSDKFDTELNILKADKERYVDYLAYENYLLLILTDYELTDIDAKMLAEGKTLSDIAKLIAHFHQKTPKNEIPVKHAVCYRIQESLQGLLGRQNYAELSAIWDTIAVYRGTIDSEYSQYRKATIHGDFGLRNLKYHDGKMILIDFERSKKDIYYLDFIKFFYTDLQSNPEQTRFFLKEYYKYVDYPTISKLLESALVFYTGLGILKYTMVFDDKKFEQTGLQMIEDVQQFFVGNE